MSFVHSHKTTRTQPSFPNCHRWRAVASKAAVAHLTLSPSSFPRLLFLASVTSHIFFLILIPLCFSLFSVFVAYPISFSPLPFSAPATCQGDSPSKRTDVFCFIFISHFWRVHFFWNAASKDPYHRFFPPSADLPRQPPPHPIHRTAASQPASLADFCLISHKLVLPLTHFLFCFSLLLIPFSPCPLLPSISLWSSHFIFLPTNATQQSLKKCHFCLLLLFCNFSVSLLFTRECIYRSLFFCPQLSDLSVSSSLSVSVSPSLSPTLPRSVSLSFFPHSRCRIGAFLKCHNGLNLRWCIFCQIILWIITQGKTKTRSVLHVCHICTKHNMCVYIYQTLYLYMALLVPCSNDDPCAIEQLFHCRTCC